MFLGTTPTLLSRAPLRINGSFCYSPDDGAGGGDDADKSKEGADKKTKKKPGEQQREEAPPEKTVDEIVAERLASERTKWEADATAKQKKADDASAKKKAEEEGKFKELAEAADKRAAEAEAKALSAERSSLIDREFFSQAKDGVTIEALNTWVRPAVLATLTPETTADDVKKSAKELAEKYAKDTAAPKPKGGVPAPLPRTANRVSPTNPEARSPRATPNGNRIITPASRF